MKRVSLMLIGLVVGFGLSACVSKDDANAINFSAAIDAYLQKHGQLCIARETWPVHLTERDRASKLAFGGGTPLQRMEALAAVGLAVKKDVDAAELPGRNTLVRPGELVYRYDLTELGEKFSRQVPRGPFASSSAEPQRAICYGRRAVQKVVKWDGVMELGGFKGTEVTYLYKVDELPDWAKDARVQEAFPEVGRELAGIASLEKTHGLHLTSEGWEANGL